MGSSKIHIFLTHFQLFVSSKCQIFVNTFDLRFNLELITTWNLGSKAALCPWVAHYPFQLNLPWNQWLQSSFSKLHFSFFNCVLFFFDRLCSTGEPSPPNKNKAVLSWANLNLLVIKSFAPKQKYYNLGETLIVE